MDLKIILKMDTTFLSFIFTDILVSQGIGEGIDTEGGNYTEESKELALVLAIKFCLLERYLYL